MYNFSKDNAYPNKNDKIFYEISNQTSEFKIYVTKIYKLVKLLIQMSLYLTLKILFLFSYLDFPK